MTPDLTAAIARIRELLALATAAPWRSMEEDVDIHTGEYEEPYVCAEPLPDGRIQSICTIRIGLPGTLANAEFTRYRSLDAQLGERQFRDNDVHSFHTSGKWQMLEGWTVREIDPGTLD